MGKRILLVLVLIYTPSLCFSAADGLFDLSAVPYFENGRFSFIQTIMKEGVRHGSRRGGFMPQEGEVEILFQSRKNKTSYEMTTESYQNGRLLYSTEAVVDRFGTTIRYVMYNDDGDLVYDYRYDPESHAGRIDYLDEDEERVRKSVTIPTDAYSMMTVPYIIGALTVSDSDRHSLSAIVGDGRKLGLYLQLLGMETVQMGDRFYSCNKVELGFSGVIGLFMPKMVFWVDDVSKIPVRQNVMGSSIVEYLPVE